MRSFHGMTKHPAYNSWRGMKNRCNNRTHIGYGYYGAKGVRVCEDWSSLDNFWRDMGPTWKEGLTLERKDANKDYCFENCVWATYAAQMLNQGRNHYVETPKGVMLLHDAARISGLHRTTIYSRIKAGWPTSDLFLPPMQ